MKIPRHTAKKVRLGNELIKERIYKQNPDFDLKNQEIGKILIIFNNLMSQIKENNSKNSNCGEEKYTPDGIKDIFISIGEEFCKFLQRGIESLDLPEIINKALKTLKAIFAFACTIKNYGQNQISCKRVYNQRRANI